MTNEPTKRTADSIRNYNNVCLGKQVMNRA